MDIEQLIREVHARPAVWNQKSTNYYYRDVVSQKWKEIAKACHVPCEAVRSKWKHLRDHFRKEFKKDMEAKNSGMSDTPQWVWYKSLWFLGDQLLTKKMNAKQSFSTAKQARSKSNSESLSADNSKDSVYDTNNSDTEIPPHAVSVYESEESLMDNHESNAESRMDDSMESNLKSRIGSFVELNGQSLEGDALLESKSISLVDGTLESNGKRKSKVQTGSWENRSKKLKCDNSTGYDDTYHFLMSLLTPLRILPYERSMMVRLKIQNIVTEEVTKLSGVPCSINVERSSDEDYTSISPTVDLSECDAEETS